jgi:thioredoxin-related protein
MVEGKRWEYDILLDKNQDLMRALGIQMPPTTYLFNGDGEIVWVHPAYIEGDEFELGERIEALAK